MAVQIDKNKCTGCGACVGCCPVDALEVMDGVITVSDGCVNCGACVPQCPCDALTL